MATPSRLLAALGLPALLAVSCRSPLTHPEEYRQAARQLQFRIVHLEPNLELALPPAQPRIRFSILLGVDNPTSVPFQARHIRSTLILDGPGGANPLGEILLDQGLDIRPHGRSEVRATVTVDAAALRGIRDLLTRVVAQKQFDGVRLEGEARVHAYGGTWTVPIHARVLKGLP